MNQRGFTFTEILFAVLLLGVGFIMMAALFPISARQLQNSSTDAAGSSAGPAALRQIQAVVGPGGSMNLAAVNSSGKSGTVMTFGDASPAIWKQLRANQIMAADPRFGWTAVYRRNALDDFARVWVIVARSPNNPVYSYATDVLRASVGGIADASSYPATLEPRSVSVTLNAASNTALFGQSGAIDNTGGLATGCYVIIADDAGTGDANGRVYQLAAAVAGSINTWNLDPAYALQDASENLTNATAYILGRAYANPTNPAAGFDGVAQEVAIYCGCVSLY